MQTYLSVLNQRTWEYAQSYVRIRLYTLWVGTGYVVLLGMFKIVQRMRACSINVTHTLTIRSTYAGHTLERRLRYVTNTLYVRYWYPIHPSVKLSSIAGVLTLERCAYICFGFLVSHVIYALCFRFSLTKP